MIPDFLIWCVNLDEASGKKFECVDGRIHELAYKSLKFQALRDENPNKELDDKYKDTQSAHIALFYQKQRYKEHYAAKLKKLMSEFEQVKKRVHDNQPWVFQTKHTRHFGGVMIEGAAWNALSGGALLAGINTLVGTQYLGLVCIALCALCMLLCECIQTLLHALVPQAAPLVIGGILFVALSKWHAGRDEWRMKRFDIPENAVALKHVTDARSTHYDDLYDGLYDNEDIEFDEDGSIAMIDLFDGNLQNEYVFAAESDVHESSNALGVYDYYPHQQRIETDYYSHPSTFYIAVGLFVVIILLFLMCLCLGLVASLSFYAFYFRQSKRDDNNALNMSV